MEEIDKSEVDEQISYIRSYIRGDIFFIILYSGILVAVGYMICYKNTWLMLPALLVSLYMLAFFSSLYIKHKAYFRYLIHKNKKGDKSE